MNKPREGLSQAPATQLQRQHGFPTVPWSAGSRVLWMKHLSIFVGNDLNIAVLLCLQGIAFLPKDSSSQGCLVPYGTCAAFAWKPHTSSCLLGYIAASHFWFLTRCGMFFSCLIQGESVPVQCRCNFFFMNLFDPCLDQMGTADQMVSCPLTAGKASRHHVLRQCSLSAS